MTSETSLAKQSQPPDKPPATAVQMQCTMATRNTGQARMRVGLQCSTTYAPAHRHV